MTLARWARAIAHPARLRILALLARRDSCICGSIVNELPLAQSTVSQHLSELKDAGFIKGEIDGPRVCYCLDHDSLRRFRERLDQVFDELERPAPPTCC